MKRLILSAVALGFAATLGACNGGSSSGGGGSYYPSKTWYDVFGYACGSLKEGCTYKYSTGDEKAMWWDDPYYSANANWVEAVVYDTDLGYYVTAYGFYGVGGVFYDYYTGRAINEGNEEKSQDLLAAVGHMEDDVVKLAGQTFSKKYNLDADVGLRVAKVVNDYNKIGTKRERTEQDLSDFTKRLYGVELNKVKDAFEKGDQSAQDSLLNEAASNWRTSPENMKAILVNMYK